MRGIIVIVVAILFSAPGEAAFVSAGDLRAHCSAKIGDRRTDLHLCLWYISAIHDAMQDGGAINDRTACFPLNLIVGNLVNPVVEFINKLPDPNKVGAAGAVILALANAYPCTDAGAEKSLASSVQMSYLRPNVGDFVGKSLHTSGYIRCLIDIDSCSVEPEPFSSGLMPYLYFQTSALAPKEKSEFYAKCRDNCFFYGIVSVVSYPSTGHVKLKPIDVKFKTMGEALRGR